MAKKKAVKKLIDQPEARPDTRHLIKEGDRVVFTNISSRQPFTVAMILCHGYKFAKALDACTWLELPSSGESFEKGASKIVLVATNGVKFPLRKCQKE